MCKNNTDNHYSDIITGDGCFSGIFSLKIKDDAMSYQPLPICVAYALQEPFRKELWSLQEQKLLAWLGVDETVEWYNSFVMVPKPNCIVCFCLYPMRLHQAFIRPVHSGPTINDILPKLTSMCYVRLLDTS